MSDVTQKIFFYGENQAPLEILTGIDLSNYSASDLSVRVSLPSGATAALAGTLTIVIAGVGLVLILLKNSELREEGEYFAQVLASKLGQPTQHSALVSFFVEPQLLAEDDKYLWAPSSVPAYSSATAFEKAHYAFWGRSKWS